MNNPNVPGVGALDAQINQIIGPIMKDPKAKLPEADGIGDVTAMLEGIDGAK